MNIKPLLPSINPRTFLADYLHANNIADVEQYLHPPDSAFDSPRLYLNVDNACARLNKTITEKQKIGILVDEDCDGICSSAIFYNFLVKREIKPVLFFHEISKSHGIRADSKENLLPNIISQNIELFIVPDASIDIQSSSLLCEKNIDICIFDHHAIIENNPYAITVNCLYQENTNHFASGTLVTNKVIERYCEIYGEEKPNNNDMVALSIASDVMSLSGGIENRAYFYKWQQEYDKLGGI